ncbi:BadF/BadG/BcrA/BcrD ATPase family protein [Clostridium massiliamazoniense]|uniref:BadF/BadG/BcrA/BcrD ATPase family protein n=1 Tax=Clostridium massiliamazoniense TaxID=1347366 RepID=UPI0006D7A9E9|nr:BadF/BadG/BcrA/BcrD ATPase family protein [Clostridium massiliamazoniense]
MKYIIGVDGGGTKTEAVAYNLEGDIIKSSLTGYGNLLNGKEEGLKNIVEAIDNIVDKLGIENLQGIYLGIAGSEVGNNNEIIKEEVKSKFNVETIVMNDSELALKALLKGEDGILTIAGTGSIAFGINGDVQWKAGGWGNLLGDEGSAYKIAIEGLKNMIYENDNSLELSGMSKAILEYLGISKPDDIIGFVYSSTKDEIAKLAQIVSKFAEEGNEVANKILVIEAINLAKSTEQVFKRLKFEKCSVGLVGGVIRKSRIFREAFENYLNKNINVISFIDDKVSPAKGGYYIFKKTNYKK